MSINEVVEINGIEYIKKNSKKHQAENLDNMEYCIVRTYSAGVFAGYVKKRHGKEVLLLNARRLWYWDGASSLSQLAMEGTKIPDKCKFPCEVDKILLTEAIEILSCTEKAKLSIAEVKIWQQ